MDVWRNGRLIFGERQKTEMDAYDDRLMQWDTEAWQRANEAVKQSGVRSNTPRWHQDWLTAYHGKPVVLRYIIAGVNWGNGYPYYFYGYDYAQAESNEKVE